MKKILKLFVVAIALLLVVSPIATKAEKKYLNDFAYVLTPDEAEYVEESLKKVSEKYNFDTVIFIDDFPTGSDLQDIADTFFDYNDYGTNANRDGILLLVDMNTRTIYFSTSGYGEYAFTDYGMFGPGMLEDKVIDAMVDYGMKDGFVKFANEVDRYLNLAHAGTPIDYEEPEKEEFVPNPIISVIVGGLASLISSFVSRGKNKSVSRKYQANDYKRKGSFDLYNANSWFLYRNLSRTRIARDNSSSSSGSHHTGSTTHISSSGRSHGGGGGHRHF